MTKIAEMVCIYFTLTADRYASPVDRMKGIQVISTMPPFLAPTSHHKSLETTWRIVDRNGHELAIIVTKLDL